MLRIRSVVPHVQTAPRLLRARTVLAAMAFVCAGPRARSAPLVDVPASLAQPDGSRVACRLSGDEFCHVARDAKGFTLIQDPASGWWVYARKEGGGLVPTSAVAGRGDPAQLGIAPGLMPDPSVWSKLRVQQPDAQSAGATLPKTGRMDNLVLFVRFADDSEFPADRPFYEALFNGPDGTASMQAYFREVSYGKMDIVSWLVPATPDASIVSYQDNQPRSYYLPYNAVTNPNGYEGESSGRKRALIQNALAWAADRLPPGMNLDADGNGVIDHVTLVIRGAQGMWGSILWPQQGSIETPGQTIGGVKPGSYDIQIEDVLRAGNLGTLCHEFFHAFGAPDLYHYTANGIDPVGVWDLMAIPARTPQHMGAFLKWKYGGWIESIPQVLREGDYALKPLAEPDTNCCRIASTATTDCYYVLEYRRPAGVFESSLPGAGLLVYRVNPSVSLGNMYGPPDAVYIYRPGGTQTANGTLRDAAFSANSGRTRIDDSTSPSGFLDNGAPGGLRLENIGPVGDTISFSLRGQYNLPELQFLVGPREVSPGQLFEPPIRVACVDMFGTVAFFSGPMTVSLVSGAGTGVRLLGRTTVTAVDGVAEFSDLRVEGSGTDLRLRVTAPGMPTLTSAPFSASGPSPTRTERVNLDGNGAQSDGMAWDVSISADGGKVAFTDNGHNLFAPMVWAEANHTYCRDIASGATRRISARLFGLPPGEANAGSALSADGRFVAFTSGSRSSTDTYLYWRDTWTGETVQLGRTYLNGRHWGFDASGRYLVFESQYAIWLFDARTGTSERISLTTNGQVITANCESPSISGDGRFVAFESAAGYVAGNWTPSAKQIYVRDLANRTTLCASLMPDGMPVAHPCTDASVSRDGRYVAFASTASYLVSSAPAYSKQVYVRDMATGKIVCVSMGNEAGVFARSAEKPSISADGSRVAFRATGQLTPDALAEFNIYLRDLRQGKTILISCSSDGTAGNADSSDLALSADGRWVAFTSSASNLVPGDTNGHDDVFRRGPLRFGTMADAARALRIAAGLTRATTSDIRSLSPLVNGQSVGVADAVRVAREAQGW